MRPSNLKVLSSVIQVPLNRTGATLPLHAVWRDPIDRPQSHFVQFTLEAHIAHAKSVLLTRLGTSDIKVEPAVVVAVLRVWHTITTHVNVEGVLVLRVPFAVEHITRVECTRDCDASGPLVCSLLRMSV